MSPREILRFALHGLGANKLRSGLTTLGILIGVGAVILLVAIGNGSSRQIQESIQRLGTNTLTVMPFRGRQAAQAGVTPRDLTVADAQALADRQGAPDVKSVSPVVSTQATATYEETSHQISQVVGTYPTYFEATNSPVAAGAAFTDQDVTEARKVVVLGQSAAEELFGRVDPIGRKVRLNGVPFQVVGVLATKGSTGFQDADDVAVAPLTAVQNALTGYGSLSQIVVQAVSADATDAAKAEISAILDARHDIADPASADYRILDQAQLLETSSETARTFTLLLAAVAAISLLVGGIGVTNIMLVTVTERTREIGIRKAIGATRGAILGQFLTEATLLSLFGGALGVLLALLLSRFRWGGVEPVVVPSSIALAFGVSVLIGLFFGSYPANRAASLRPIEALRHE